MKRCELRTVPLCAIVEGTNYSRGADGYTGDLHALARAMRASEHIDPFVLRQMTRSSNVKPGEELFEITFELVAGFRRYRALCYWRDSWPEDCPIEVPAQVYGAELEESELATINLIENIRLNPSSYENMMAVAELKKLGLSSRDISSQLGYHVSHVDNLCHAAKHLVDEIKQAMKNGEYFPTREIFRVSFLTADEQIDWYEHRQKRERPPPRFREYIRRPSEAIDRARLELRAEGDEVRARVLDWVLGERFTL